MDDLLTEEKNEHNKYKTISKEIIQHIIDHETFSQRSTLLNHIITIYQFLPLEMICILIYICLFL